jgi:hypothetical protein
MRAGEGYGQTEDDSAEGWILELFSNRLEFSIGRRTSWAG